MLRAGPWARRVRLPLPGPRERASRRAGGEGTRRCSGHPAQSCVTRCDLFCFFLMTKHAERQLTGSFINITIPFICRVAVAHVKTTQNTHRARLDGWAGSNKITLS